MRKDLSPLEITDLWLEHYGKNVGFLHRVKWHRIVLDGQSSEISNLTYSVFSFLIRSISAEGQQIRNHKTKQSVAVRALPGKIRWFLSGKPVYKWEILFKFSLIKFWILKVEVCWLLWSVESKSSIRFSTFLGSLRQWSFKDFYSIYARWVTRFIYLYVQVSV